MYKMAKNPEFIIQMTTFQGVIMKQKEKPLKKGVFY